MIRPCERKDLAIISAIGNRAWEQIYNMYRDAYGEELFCILVPNPATVKSWEIENFCAKTPKLALVCERDGKVVGFITLIIDDEKKIGEIGNNAVDPLSGERGVGQEMYRAAFELFREKGMKFAKVTTGMDEAHAPARRAYERADFDIHHELITYHKRL
jgi:ribosomal protein S18 acetylase RimI-like enzyme